MIPVRLDIEIDASPADVTAALAGWPLAEAWPFVEGRAGGGVLVRVEAAAHASDVAGRLAARARFLLEALRARVESGVDLAAFDTSGLFYPGTIEVEGTILAPPDRVARALVDGMASRAETPLRRGERGGPIRAVRQLPDVAELAIVEWIPRREGAGTHLVACMRGFSPIEEWWTLEERLRLLPNFVLARCDEEERLARAIEELRAAIEEGTVVRDGESVDAPPDLTFPALASPGPGWRAIETDAPRRAVLEAPDGSLVEIAIERVRSGLTSGISIVQTGVDPAARARWERTWRERLESLHGLEEPIAAPEWPEA